MTWGFTEVFNLRQPQTNAWRQQGSRVSVFLPNVELLYISLVRSSLLGWLRPSPGCTIAWSSLSPIFLPSPSPLRGVGPASWCEGFHFLSSPASPPLYLTDVTPNKFLALWTLSWRTQLTDLIEPATELLLEELLENFKAKLSFLQDLVQDLWDSEVKAWSVSHSRDILVFISHFPGTCPQLLETRDRFPSNPCPWLDFCLLLLELEAQLRDCFPDKSSATLFMCICL